MNVKTKKKRHFLLLEILICFALIVLCFLPLISPHVYILRAQQEFVDKIELDHVISLLYADLFEQLHLNQVPFQQIEDKVSMPVTQAMLDRIGYKKKLPYKLSYKIQETKHKPKEKDFTTLYLLKVTYTLSNGKDKDGKDQKVEYTYDLFLIRQLKKGTMELPPQEMKEVP